MLGLRAQRGVWSRLEIVREESFVRIEMEGDAGGGRDESFGIYMADDGYQGSFVGGILELVAARTEEVFDAGSRSPLRKLGVQHFIDFLEAGVGSVGVTLAPKGHHRREKYSGGQRKQPRDSSRQLNGVAATYHQAPRLLDYFEARFFDDRVGEHFFGNVLDLFQRFVAGQAFDIQHEEFSLANVFDRCITQTRERMLNGLSLRIEYRALRHHPNMCFHGLSITLPAVLEFAGGG